MAAPFLVKRRAGWYIPIRVPAGLDVLFGSHLTRTLKTRDYALARRRAVAAAARLQGCWQEAWRAIDDDSDCSRDLLTADDLIRTDRQRLRHGGRLGACAVSPTDELVYKSRGGGSTLAGDFAYRDRTSSHPGASPNAPLHPGKPVAPGLGKASPPPRWFPAEKGDHLALALHRCLAPTLDVKSLRK